jgi:hypothetical protein
LLVSLLPMLAMPMPIPPMPEDADAMNEIKT